MSAYEAKTHLPRLLNEVEAGDAITITRHGVPIARLVPAPEGRHQATCHTIAALREFRRGKTLGGIQLRDLIEGGRR